MINEQSQPIPLPEQLIQATKAETLEETLDQLEQTKGLDYPALLQREGNKLNSNGKTFAYRLYKLISRQSRNKEDILQHLQLLRNHRDTITAKTEDGRVTAERMVFTRTIQSIEMKIRAVEREQLTQNQYVEGSAVSQIVEVVAQALTGQETGEQIAAIKGERAQEITQSIIATLEGKKAIAERTLTTSLAIEAAKVAVTKYKTELGIILNQEYQDEIDQAVIKNRAFLIDLLIERKKMNPVTAREAVLSYEKEIGVGAQNERTSLMGAADRDIARATTDVDKMNATQMVNTLYGTYSPEGMKFDQRHQQKLEAHAERIQALQNYAERYRKEHNPEAETVMNAVAEELETLANVLPKKESPAKLKPKARLSKPRRILQAGLAVLAAVGSAGQLMDKLGFTSQDVQSFAKAPSPIVRDISYYMEEDAAVIGYQAETKYEPTEIELTVHERVVEQIEPSIAPIPPELRNQCLRLVEDATGNYQWTYVTNMDEIPECQERFPGYKLADEVEALPQNRIPEQDYIRERFRGEETIEQGGFGICQLVSLTEAIASLQTSAGITATLGVDLVSDFFRKQPGDTELQDVGDLNLLEGLNSELNRDIVAANALEAFGVNLTYDTAKTLFGYPTSVPYPSSSWATKLNGRIAIGDWRYFHATYQELLTSEKVETKNNEMWDTFNQALDTGEEIVVGFNVTASSSGFGRHAMRLVGTQEIDGIKYLVFYEANGGSTGWKFTKNYWVEAPGPIVKVPLDTEGRTLSSMTGIFRLSNATQEDRDNLVRVVQEGSVEITTSTPDITITPISPDIIASSALDSTATVQSAFQDTGIRSVKAQSPRKATGRRPLKKMKRRVPLSMRRTRAQEHRTNQRTPPTEADQPFHDIMLQREQTIRRLERELQKARNLGNQQEESQIRVQLAQL